MSNRVTDVTHKSDGTRVLNDVEKFLSRFLAYPGEHERVAHVLWIGHTWLMDVWESTPRIAFLSPEVGSGKSRALEITEPLVPRPAHAINATPAYLFRKVSDPEGPPTILFDEIDTIFGPKAKDNEDLRGMLNAGHRKGAMAGRCVIRGKEILTEELPAYAAVALAGLDDLPDTLMSRSVVVRMRRRAPGEKVEPWRLRTGKSAVKELGNQLEEWTSSVEDLARQSWPDMPEGVEDRDADIWEALLAVADLAGGDWPRRGREAAVGMVKRSQERVLSIGLMLLRDIRIAFTAAKTERLSTEDLLDALIVMDESPWGDIRGKELDPRSLARRLSKYTRGDGGQKIGPRSLRDGDAVFKGYDVADFRDAWSRYLPEEPRVGPEDSVTSVTELQTGQESNRVTHVTDESGDTGAVETDPTCTVCFERMIPTDGSTMHPMCEVDAVENEEGM